MNSKLSKKFGTAVMVFLITVCFIPAMAGAAAPGDGRHDKGFDRPDHHGPVLGIWRNLQMVENLELTKEQVKQLREADFAFREKHLVLKAEIDRLRLQMDRAFSDDSVNDTAVLQLAKQISDVKGKLFVQNIESRLALGKLLNADQIKKMKLYDMHQGRKGPEQGEKHGFRGYSMEKSDDKMHFEN